MEPTSAMFVECGALGDVIAHTIRDVGIKWQRMDGARVLSPWKPARSTEAPDKDRLTLATEPGPKTRESPILEATDYSYRHSPL